MPITGTPDLRRDGRDCSANFVHGLLLRCHYPTCLPLGSFPIGPKTGVNFVLVEDSFANVVILGHALPSGETGKILVSCDASGSDWSLSVLDNGTGPGD